MDWVAEWRQALQTPAPEWALALAKVFAPPLLEEAPPVVQAFSPVLRDRLPTTAQPDPAPGISRPQPEP